MKAVISFSVVCVASLLAMPVEAAPCKRGQIFRETKGDCVSKRSREAREIRAFERKQKREAKRATTGSAVLAETGSIVTVELPPTSGIPLDMPPLKQPFALDPLPKWEEGTVKW